MNWILLNDAHAASSGTSGACSLISSSSQARCWSDLFAGCLAGVVVEILSTMMILLLLYMHHDIMANFCEYFWCCTTPASKQPTTTIDLLRSFILILLDIKRAARS
jgi:hypothetical protein